MAAASGVKGKLNRKKRKRRTQQQQRHSRSGSKTSLKEIVAAENANIERSSSSESGEQGEQQQQQSPTKAHQQQQQQRRTEDDDDDNEGDVEDDNDFAASTPLRLNLTNVRPADASAAMTPSLVTPARSEGAASEHSFLLSRVDDSVIDVIESGGAAKSAKDEEAEANDPANTICPGSYFSEPEMTPITSPIGSRPGTPNVLSDSECYTKQEGTTEKVTI